MRRPRRLVMMLCPLYRLRAAHPARVVVADDAIVATCDDASFSAALATAQQPRQWQDYYLRLQRHDRFRS
ncbi:MAG: hypothetical protein R2849_11675 [Thermomicrobiales bacterium]